MSKQTVRVDLEELYRESDYWHVNTGGKTVHAKRMPGRYRKLKWVTATVWLLFFLGPYMRWGGRQAVLFDIPGRQFHIFGLTILPQDVWMLAMVLLFFALLLAAVTSLAGRVYCGFFCFQTVWTDVFTWIEEKLEGPPHKRAKLDQAPWTFAKYRVKLTKHFIFLLISVLTGVSFTLWFGDAFELWGQYLTLKAPLIAWDTVAVFTFFTYLFAGYMREQVCFWLCPYARIQGVMADQETVLPTYDFSRGEPRGKLKKGEDAQLGDCIDCKQCVAVCPTGIDIRRGQQEGCITCALCLDACDAVMDKVGRPRGLIRYASLNEIKGIAANSFFKRPRVLVYFTIMLAALGGIVYGLISLGSIDLKVLHERQPLFVIQSDGSVQNKYELKLLNKTDQLMRVKISVSGPNKLAVIGADEPLSVPSDQVAAYTIFIRVPGDQLTEERTPIIIQAQDTAHPEYSAVYNSMFFGPRR